jgi:uncharacterized membrane protein YcaP (DUF421 family)
MIWNDMMVMGVPLLEKILRPIIVYAVLLLLLRVFGKRELAQLNPYDLIVLLTLSNTVQNAIIGNDNSVTGGVLGAITLLAVNYVVVKFLYRHESLDRLIEGDETVLVDNGVLMKKALDQELITRPALEAAAHKQGFASLDEVDRVILEPGGTLCFVGKKPSSDVIRHEELLAQLAEVRRLLSARTAS